MNALKVDEEVYREVESIILANRDEKTPLLSVLQGISQVYGYLPRDVMEYVSRKLNIPSSKVFGVATFYSFFETRPVGKYMIRICQNAPCHVLGASNILRILKKELNIKEGETTKDGKFTLEVTSCLGVCGVAPAMMINETTYGNLNEERIREVLALYQ
ncbi:MAG: NADH-quinone oxidoreductase subunit NuoE [Candidatus Atribacteria bacterium]|nr:NADH-quinone oxidoreductase subunit NuoE [Candidatus Atribacteria bacterium]